jgi:hypothetical protein
MYRSIYVRGLLIALLGAAGACGSNTPATPTTPTPPATVTDTFSGTLNQNGGVTHPFTTASSGSVQVTLTALAPVDTLKIGLSLGTWNGTACTVVIANDAASKTSVVSGTVSSASSLCVRVYDVGNVKDPISYTVTVVHP